MSWFAILLIAVHAADSQPEASLSEELCGWHSLALVSSFLDVPIDRPRLDAVLPVAGAPFSIADLDHAGRALGLQTLAVTWKSTSQITFRCPAILHIRAKPDSVAADHFIVAFGAVGGKVCIANFPFNARLIDAERLGEFWDGTALYIEPNNGSAIKSLKRTARWQLARRWGGGVAIGAIVIVGFRLITKRRLAAKHAASHGNI